MTTHEGAQQKVQALLSQVSPEFMELTADISEVIKQANNPMLIAALLYKLAQERHQTNELIKQMENKYDELSFQLKTNGMGSSLPTPNQPSGAHSISILPEQDQKIMKLVESHQKIDAQLVKEKLGYKNPNAASQRLNILVRAGYLGKIQSGKKVVFIRANV
ncbi:MAG: hypothetical protein V1776_05165 [Candidatus Diapherotrites archaeon]